MNTTNNNAPATTVPHYNYSLPELARYQPTYFAENPDILLDLLTELHQWRTMYEDPRIDVSTRYSIETPEDTVSCLISMDEEHAALASTNDQLYEQIDKLEEEISELREQLDTLTQATDNNED